MWATELKRVLRDDGSFFLNVGASGRVMPNRSRSVPAKAPDSNNVATRVLPQTDDRIVTRVRKRRGSGPAWDKNTIETGPPMP